MYCKCPEAFRRRHIEGEVIPPGMAMHKGSGMHGGANTNFVQKRETFVDLPVDDIIDASVAAFEHECERRGYQLDDDEKSRGAVVVVAEAKDEVAELAKAYAKEQAPQYQPILVEEPVRIVVPNSSHDIFGYIDLLAEDSEQLKSMTGDNDTKRIVDFKTTRKKKNQADVDDSLPLTFYAAAAHILHGAPVDEVRLEVLIRYANRVGRQVLVSQRGQADYAVLSHRMNAVLAGIKAGIFPPTNPMAWWCSPKWCGFWHTCPYTNSDRLHQIEG